MNAEKDVLHDIVYVNRAFAALHSRDGGQRTLRFPRPITMHDLFAGTDTARGAEQVTLDIPPRSTTVWYIGEAPWGALDTARPEGKNQELP